MRRSLALAAVLVSPLAIPAPSHAAGTEALAEQAIVITVDGNVVPSSSDVKNVFDRIREDELRRAQPYDEETSKVNAVVDFLGREMNFSFPGAGNELELEVPSLDIKKKFKGKSTRDESVDLLEDFLNSKVVEYSIIPGLMIIADEGVPMYTDAPSKLFGNWFNKKTRTTGENEKYTVDGYKVYPTLPSSGNQIWVKLKPVNSKGQNSGWALLGWQSRPIESTGSVNIFLQNEFASAAR